MKDLQNTHSMCDICKQHECYMCCAVHAYMYLENASVHTYIYTQKTHFRQDISKYRAARTHRMPNLYTSFSAKEPYN